MVEFAPSLRLRCFMIFMAMGGSTMAPKAKAAASETAKAAARIASYTPGPRYERWRQLTTVFPSSRGGRPILCGGWMPDKVSGLATCIPFGWTCNFGAGNLPGGAIFIGASMLYMLDAIYSGWWFVTCFIFHNIWDVNVISPMTFIFFKMVKNHQPVIIIYHY